MSALRINFSDNRRFNFKIYSKKFYSDLEKLFPINSQLRENEINVSKSKSGKSDSFKIGTSLIPRLPQSFSLPYQLRKTFADGWSIHQKYFQLIVR